MDETSISLHRRNFFVLCKNVFTFRLLEPEKLQLRGGIVLSRHVGESRAAPKAPHALNALSYIYPGRHALRTLLARPHIPPTVGQSRPSSMTNNHRKYLSGKFNPACPSERSRPVHPPPSHHYIPQPHLHSPPSDPPPTSCSSPYSAAQTTPNKAGPA